MRPYVFGENAYVVLEGELDLYRKDEVAAALPDPRQVHYVVVNLVRARYIDSVILGMLVGFRRQFLKAGGDPQNFALMLARDSVIRRSLELTGLNRLFTIAYVESAPVLEERLAQSALRSNPSRTSS